MGCFSCFDSKEEEKLNTVNETNDPKRPQPIVSSNISRLSSGGDRLRSRSNGGSKREIPSLRDGPGVQIAAQTFSFRELAAATKNFRPESFLGEGGFGRVYKGRLESTGQVVAVKQLDRNGLQGNREFLVEVLMLSLLHHPNLVNLIGYCADGDQRLLVYEFMPLGSLEDHLHDLPPGKEPLDWNMRMKIAAGAAKGLEYLHDKANPPVIYRDFKSSNILLEEGFHPKLSDFGLAKLGPVGDKSHVSTRVMGTYGYCAPEYAMTGQLTVKSDVYSFGVVFLELITGRKAIDSSQPHGEQNLIAWARPLFNNRRKLSKLADPLLQGRYPMRGLYQALAVAEEERIGYLIEKCPDTRVIRQIHAHVLTRLLPISAVSFLLSKIVGFCALSRHGDINHARKVFAQTPNPNIFTWNSLIRGYYLVGSQSKVPLFLYKELVRKGYPSANTFTLAFVLKACSNILAFDEGKQVHARVFRSGFGSNQFVQTGLLNFYAKCEDIGLAEKVFDEIHERNVIAWSTMISGYAMMGLVNKAFGAFREMQTSNVVPDKVTMVSVISACAMAGALDIGRWIHAYIEKHMIETDIMLSTALVNMYAKCGCIEKATEIFKGIPVKDHKAWSSMIVGLAVHGLAEEALEAFSRMEESKVTPSHVTFIGVLSACAHGGLVSEGRRYWSSMIELGIEPSIEHYGCMVDLLCRASLVGEACNFVQTMPFYPNPVIWRTLLIGCQKNKMLHKGEVAGEQLLALEPSNPENYILLSNFYASVAQWEKMSHVRKMMKERGMKVVPGCASIEIDGFVHEFVMGDWHHPEAKEIRQALRVIAERVSDAGYESQVSDVLHNVGNEEKGIYLCEHSERLAIAYGILKTKAPVPIRIVKNLRVCIDCHEVTKIISKIYEREIIVRDRVRFHKFVDGTCSCKDYW